MEVLDIVPVLMTALIFLVLNYVFRESFYKLLNQLLNTDSVSVRAAGEVISLTDSVIKSWGFCFLVYLITFGFGVTIFPPLSVWGFVIFFTVAFFALRHWVYPFIVGSFNTKSKFDDFLFVVDLLLRAVGFCLVAYQMVVMVL